MLVGCQDDEDKDHVIEGRNAKKISVFEGVRGKGDTPIKILNEQEIQEFEDIVYNIPMSKDVSEDELTITHSFDLKYEENLLDGISLVLGNEKEKSYFFHGRDSYSERRIYEVSPEETSRLRELIEN